MVTRVLIGEDEALVAMDLEMTLTEMGYFVVGIGSSGETIIHLNRELHPDIILMDIRLRGPMNGFQAATQIQKENDVPILFVTAGPEATLPHKPLKPSMYGFLRKPFSDEKLKEALSGLLKGRERY